MKIITIVTLPPIKTDGTVPKRLAAKPRLKGTDFNWKRLQKYYLLIPPYPAYAQAGITCNIVCRITTLMLSKAPVKNNITTESIKLVEMAKIMVA